MALIVFWVCVALIVYTYAGYPVVLWILASFTRHSLPPPSDHLRVTVLITAHNETFSIEEKLLNTLSLDYPSDRLQIIVVSDGSTDATETIVKRFSSKGVELIEIPIQAGKTHAQNIGVQAANGDVVVFSDATTAYNSDALRVIVGNYSNPLVGAVSGRYLYINPRTVSPTGQGASAYAGYDNTIRRLQSEVWSITGCCGCIYSVRRNLYTVLANDIISDLVQPLHVLKKGYRVVLEPRAIACEFSTSSTRNEFNMRVRVITRALRGLFSVYDLLLPWQFPWIAFQLWSHKLLRWTVPFFLFGLFISSASLLDKPFYRIVFGLQVLFYTFAVLTSAIPLHRYWRSLNVPLYFCTINAAAIGGIFQLIRGQRYTIWSPDRNDSVGGD